MAKKPETQGQIVVEAVALSALIPYAANSRTHSESQIRQLAASMREFGWTNPVLIDAGNGIVAGHGRVMAAELLRESGTLALPNLPDITAVPCIRLGHLSDAQRRAYVIADNRLAENAGWDYTVLAAELARLQADGDIDPTITGFDADAIAVMLDTEPVPDLESLENQYGAHDGSQFWPTIRVQVPSDVMERFDSLMALTDGEHDWQKLDRILAAVDTTQVNQP